MSALYPTSQEPLYPLTIENIKGGSDSDGEVDPSFFLNQGDANSSDAQLQSKFWLEAHTLSCLKHSTFESSVDCVYNDTIMLSILLDGDTEHKQDVVRNTIGECSICACIADDGTIVNDGSNNNSYNTAFCIRKKGSKGPSSGIMSASEQQIETIAQLSSEILIGRHGKEKSEAHSTDNQTPSAAQSGGWFSYPTSIAKRITSGVTYAMDRLILGGDDIIGIAANNVTANLDGGTQSGIEEEDDDASASIKKMLLTGKISGSRVGEDEDDYAMTRKGMGAATNTVRQDHAPGNTDEVISLDVVVWTCQNLLSYSQSPNVESNHDDFFTLGGSHRGEGGIERVILYRNGWGVCSLGSYCRQAGKHYTMLPIVGNTATNDNEKLMQIGKILSSISEKGVKLLERILVKSNYAIVENDSITLFLGGIPADNFTPCQSDHALFQIHVTKITIQHRMTCLEQDANVAKQHASKAHRSKREKVALVHMRRRKAVLEELDRCASILSNLDASELRLQKAQADKQVVETFQILKTAFQDVRKMSNMDQDNVEELLMNIREEMEEMPDLGREAIYDESAAIDEDELKEEFLKLELECENEKKAEGSNEEVVREQPDNNSETEQLKDEDPKKEAVLA